MTDTLSRRDVTVEDQLAAARAEITRLTDNVRWLEMQRAQAEEGQQAEKEATAAAEERTQAEADRADGAEAHLRRVLVEFVVEPATGEVEGRDADDLHQDVLTVVAECLMEDMEGGLRVDELSGRAVQHLTDGVGR
jgi:hypothetical protein